MFTRISTDLDTSLFDPEHDMDLVVLASKARSERDVESVVRLSRARMRARRAELRVGQRRRRGFRVKSLNGTTPGSSRRG